MRSKTVGIRLKDFPGISETVSTLWRRPQELLCLFNCQNYRPGDIFGLFWFSGLVSQDRFCFALVWFWFCFALVWFHFGSVLQSTVSQTGLKISACLRFWTYEFETNLMSKVLSYKPLLHHSHFHLLVRKGLILSQHCYLLGWLRNR